MANETGNALSIIIPVYNAEEYLCDCIDSVLAQTLRNIHVILVDDGSTDNSLRLCMEYAEADKRITVIHKENGGPSSARNTGIHASFDEYLIFVDADDRITPECCDALMREHMASGAEFVLGGRVLVNVDGLEKHVPYSLQCAPWRESGKAMNDLYLTQTLNFVTGSLYVRSKIKDEFDEGLSIGEDLLFNLAYLREIVSVAVLATPCYIYFIRALSLSRRYNPDYVMICKLMHREAQRQFGELKQGYDIRKVNRIFTDNIRRAVGMLARASDITFAEKRKILAGWLSDDELFLDIQNSETLTAISMLFGLVVRTRSAVVMLCAISLYNLMSGIRLRQK